jgi:hypothetical protein
MRLLLKCLYKNKLSIIDNSEKLEQSREYIAVRRTVKKSPAWANKPAVDDRQLGVFIRLSFPAFRMAPAGRDVADPRRGFLDFRRSLAYLSTLRLGSQPSKPRTAPAIISTLASRSPPHRRSRRPFRILSGRPAHFITAMRLFAASGNLLHAGLELLDVRW